jgi:hypothetical protein
MGSPNEPESKDTKARRRGRLFEVSPPPAAEPAATPPTVVEARTEEPVANDEAVANDTANNDEPPAEPNTERVAPQRDSEDPVSIDAAAVAPIEDASEASAKLAHDERMRKPTPAIAYTKGSADRQRNEPSSVRPDSTSSAMVRRSAPSVGLHPSPRRRGAGWAWLFVPAVLVVLVLAALYVSGYRISENGLVPPPLHPPVTR